MAARILPKRHAAEIAGRVQTVRNILISIVAGTAPPTVIDAPAALSRQHILAPVARVVDALDRALTDEADARRNTSAS